MLQQTLYASSSTGFLLSKLFLLLKQLNLVINAIKSLDWGNVSETEDAIPLLSVIDILLIKSTDFCQEIELIKTLIHSLRYVDKKLDMKQSDLKSYISILQRKVEGFLPKNYGSVQSKLLSHLYKSSGDDSPVTNWTQQTRVTISQMHDKDAAEHHRIGHRNAPCTSLREAQSSEISGSSKREDVHSNCGENGLKPHVDDSSGGIRRKEHLGEVQLREG